MKSNLGTFNGFNTKTGKYLEDTLTADQVIAWNHYQDGIVEFWPSGDRPEVRYLLGPHGHPSPRFLMSLDKILQALGGDTLGNSLKVHYVVNGLEHNLDGMKPEEVIELTSELGVSADTGASVRSQFFELERMFEEEFTAGD